MLRPSTPWSRAWTGPAIWLPTGSASSWLFSWSVSSEPPRHSGPHSASDRRAAGPTGLDAGQCPRRLRCNVPSSAHATRGGLPDCSGRPQDVSPHTLLDDGGTVATEVVADEKTDIPEFSSELTAVHEGPEHRRALVSGLLVAAAGLASTALLYLFIAHLQSQGRSAAALGMADMHMNNMRKFWSFPLLQASGLTGLFFAWASAMLGLQRSSRALPWLPLSYRQVDRLHRQISLLVLALVGVHVVTTALDAMGDSWKTVLIPGEWGHLGWPQAVWAYD